MEEMKFPRYLMLQVKEKLKLPGKFSTTDTVIKYILCLFFLEFFHYVYDTQEF